MMTEVFDEYKQQERVNKKALTVVCNDMYYPEISPQHYISQLFISQIFWSTRCGLKLQNASIRICKILKKQKQMIFFSNTRIAMNDAVNNREDISNTSPVELKNQNDRHKEN